jgi:hypothetical protein
VDNTVVFKGIHGVDRPRRRRTLTHQKSSDTASREARGVAPSSWWRRSWTLPGWASLKPHLYLDE